MSDKFILGVDIGNTNTVLGLFRDEPQHKIYHSWRTVTRTERTSDELGLFLRGFMQSSDVVPDDVEGFVYSSVVPAFNPITERMARDYYRCEPMPVDCNNVPLRYSYPRPYEIGADRLVNAVAAGEIYGGPLIVIDLGTATTFCVLNGDEYIGGAIAPGLKISIDVLSRKTAQLPAINFLRPAEGVIGLSTIHALQSGFFFGWVGMMRNLRDEIRKALPHLKFQTVATGGLSTLIHREEPHLFDVVDTQLTLKGLKLIYQYNMRKYENLEKEHG